ncbi:MAG: Fic family protein [Desulfovibrio sp.]|jgi:Fic family protein|nr:Fic family protein [Desulfovibrio sp.]
MDRAEDKLLVTRVMTFKSGKVAFSRNYSREAVVEDIVRFEALFHALAALPIVPGLAAQLDTDLIRRSIFSTAAIEGNPLSEEEVGEILAEPAGKTVRARAEQEIVNLGKAYRRVAPPVPGEPRVPFVVTEQFIRELNQIITADINHKDHTPGQYRNHMVEVGNADHGGKYVPPRILADIQPLMAAFVEWINSEEVMGEGALVRAALAHYHLGLIHPFGDGNGRTARLVEAMILQQAGYRYIPVLMSNFYYKSIDEYYVAFQEAEKASASDITPFIKYFMRVVLLSAKDIQDRIHWGIRIMALRHLYDAYMQDKTIGRRQHDLLQVLLLHPGKAISLKDLHLDPLCAPLYRSVSEKTARRDLARLQELRLLLEREQGLVLNPFVME